MFVRTVLMLHNGTHIHISTYELYRLRATHVPASTNSILSRKYLTAYLELVLILRCVIYVYAIFLKAFSYMFHSIQLLLWQHSAISILLSVPSILMYVACSIQSYDAELSVRVHHIVYYFLCVKRNKQVKLWIACQTPLEIEEYA